VKYFEAKPVLLRGSLNQLAAVEEDRGHPVAALCTEQVKRKGSLGHEIFKPPKPKRGHVMEYLNAPQIHSEESLFLSIIS
jgi:hypothetical protein